MDAATPFPEVGMVMDCWAEWRARPVTVRDCILAAEKVTGVSRMEIRGRRRHKDICTARHIAMWAARRYTSRSFPEIARVLGDRDHTTIMHGTRQIDNLLDRNFGAVPEMVQDVVEHLERIRRAVDPLGEVS